MAMTTMTLEEVMSVSEEELRAEEESVKRIPCPHDPDCPPLTEETIKAYGFRRIRPREKTS